MPISLPEFSHPLIQSLAHHSDRELLTLGQRHPEQGRYFIALYCRYSPMIHTLVTASARSPQNPDSLFALTWREIFQQLPQLTLNQAPPLDSFQNWLIHTVAVWMQTPSTDVPGDYDLTTPPPLGFYTEQALEQLPPRLRFVVVMTEKFGWSEAQILSHLRQEDVSLEEVSTALHQGYQRLQDAIPEDVRQIYLAERTPATE